MLPQLNWNNFQLIFWWLISLASLFFTIANHLHINHIVIKSNCVNGLQTLNNILFLQCMDLQFTYIWISKIGHYEISELHSIKYPSHNCLFYQEEHIRIKGFIRISPYPLSQYHKPSYEYHQRSWPRTFHLPIC